METLAHEDRPDVFDYFRDELEAENVDEEVVLLVLEVEQVRVVIEIQSDCLEVVELGVLDLWVLLRVVLQGPDQLQNLAALQSAVAGCFFCCYSYSSDKWSAKGTVPRHRVPPQQAD